MTLGWAWSMSKRVKTILVQVLKLGAGVALIYWLVSRGDLDFAAIKYVLTPFYLSASILIMLISLFANHFRWYSLLKARGFELSLFGSFPITLMGLFFNFTLPGSVGGDFAKVLYMSKHFKDRRLDAATTVLVDRIIGLYVMVIMSVGASLMNAELIFSKPVVKSIFISLMVILVGVGVGGAIFVSKWAERFDFSQSKWLNFKWLSPAKKILGALMQYRNHSGALVVGVLSSLCSQFLVIFFFMLVAHSLGENVGMAAVVFSVCLGFIVSAVPLSPGGVGVGQVAFLYFFKLYTGQTLKVATIGITLIQVIVFAIGLVGFLYFLRTGRIKTSEIEMAYD